MLLVKQGAEAKIFKVMFYDKEALVKIRSRKSYRHSVLDCSLNNKRTKAEIRCSLKCKMIGIRTPAIYFVDFLNNKIYMEYIKDSITVKQFISENNVEGADDFEQSNLYNVARNIGHIIATMHNDDIVHGDLTTSNFLVDTSNNQIAVIDFGLGSTVSTLEDKAVDLYVLERAILSSHPKSVKFIEEIMKSYKSNISASIVGVLKKLEEVRQRGRKRSMAG
ncbi:hypothetical protein HELRODRAFT_156421 [Helobdella robusta]|uniref:non-specific serine/threonine protein kinase n=1 Tax=Helobdella robusta TaxID=6412 RepID=T1ELW0_HELRO|nr:hypothetical protein HELRODRAFT_156421 [Helobdella robusta]ESO09256.1 hypothetical protein HELRODRAFT_156421 [Helobdella robusta]